MSVLKTTWPPRLEDARQQIERELRNLPEPNRTALMQVHSAMETAQALAVVSFGEAATPDHALVLLDHLFTQVERVDAEQAAFEDG